MSLYGCLACLVFQLVSSLSLSLIFGNLQWKIQKLRKKASKRLRMRLGKQLAPLQRNISTFFCRFSHWFLLVSNFSLFVLSNLRFSNCILSLFILFSFVRPLKINQTEHKQNAHTNTKSTRMDLTEFGQRERERAFFILRNSSGWEWIKMNKIITASQEGRQAKPRQPFTKEKERHYRMRIEKVHGVLNDSSIVYLLWL